MRIVFFGTGSFAVPALKVLHDRGYDVVYAVTAKPKPSGRGRRLVPSPVAEAAGQMGIRVLSPADPHAPGILTELASAQPDAGVLAAYGVILRPAILRLPRLGIVNLHPSLLPAYRGAAPIQHQIMNGESRGGVTLIVLTEQVDAGDIIGRIEVDITSDETGGELMERLANVGAEILPSALTALELGTARRLPQDHTKATYAPRITGSDRVIDWSRTAREIHDRVRALSPKPGAITSFRGRQLMIVRSRPLMSTADSLPGTIGTDSGGLYVACGDGQLELILVKPEGSRAQTGADFRNGHRLKSGERLG